MTHLSCRGFIAILAILFGSALPGAAQTKTIAYDGSEIFCHILKHFKFEPLRSMAEFREKNAEETLIVVFGDLKPLHDLGVPDTSLDGYALLIASDRESEIAVEENGIVRIRELLAPWKLRITGAKVNQPADTAFKNRPRCPLLKDEIDAHHHPVFRGITRGIATNEPSLLTEDDIDLHLLAAYPNDCYFAGFSDRRVHRWRRNAVSAIVGTRGDSPDRVLILAGHGVFMNGMIIQTPDNDNGMFAINTVRWLRDGPNGKRKYALMIHDGKIVESFNLPLTVPPQIPLPPVQLINRMLREMENEGIPRRFFDEVIGWQNVMRFALIAGTLGLMLYGIFRLFPARHKQEAVPLVIGMQPPPAPGRSVLEQRQFELLTSDNLWEPAHALARQWFFDHAEVNAPLWDEAKDTPQPVVQYRAGWWTRQRLMQQVGKLWSYAVSDPAQRVSLHEFRKLTDMLQALNHAVQAAQIVFPRGKTPTGS